MRTELPTERLHRRLGAETESDTDDEGQHSDTALTRWLPDAKTDAAGGWLATIRADPGRAGVVALAVVGVLAVLVTVFALLRDHTPAVASAKLPPVQPVSSSSPASAPADDAPVVVSVVGLVHTPGLVTLDAGARIADALDKAGGALDGADLMGLNMARRVADGEQIVVGISAPPGEPVAMGSSVSDGAAATAPPGTSGTPSPADGDDAAAGPVNLNTATVEELDTLPGIGPVTAAAIVAWRDANGQFTSVEQLGEVDGIGPARLEKLRNRVHV